MTQNEEREAIFKALETYKKEYNSDYYCIILTPNDDNKVTIPGNNRLTFAYGDEAGKMISDLVDRELLLKPIKRE